MPYVNYFNFEAAYEPLDMERLAQIMANAGQVRAVNPRGRRPRLLNGLEEANFEKKKRTNEKEESF